jgi:mono/diheme cytochrome c family protein
MKITEAVPLIAFLLGTSVMARAQTTVPPLDGEKLFFQYCTACHGPKATGGGPMAAALKAKVPDLTRISKRNHGLFPLDEVQKIIIGEKRSGLSHGTPGMPLWGPIFSQDISDRDYGKLRAYNVAKYLEGLQK